MGKGCAPRKGHNQEKQSKNYDAAESQSLMAAVWLFPLSPDK
jgi:hypothetical protein